MAERRSTHKSDVPNETARRDDVVGRRVEAKRGRRQASGVRGAVCQRDGRAAMSSGRSELGKT